MTGRRKLWRKMACWTCHKNEIIRLDTGALLLFYPSLGCASALYPWRHILDLDTNKMQAFFEELTCFSSRTQLFSSSTDQSAESTINM